MIMAAAGAMAAALYGREVDTMAENAGFGSLGDQMVRLFRTGAPDFEAAEELIRQGADLNATGKDEKNILSEILMGYWESAYGDAAIDACEECEDERCGECADKQNLNPDPGASMCSIIRFFLDHGFDVTKRDGCFGAQCLSALAWSTFDRSMIAATKMLLDAGARNRSCSTLSGDDDDTPRSVMETEETIMEIVEHDNAAANIFEAVCRIYQAVDNGRPYGGIDSWEAAVGRKILRVLADSGQDRPAAVSMVLPDGQKEHGCTSTLYFVYDGGVLIAEQCAAFWTDTVLPDAALDDVSANFAGVVGSAIRRFTFEHRSLVQGAVVHGQPVTTLEMDSGWKVRFSAGAGGAKGGKQAARIELMQGMPPPEGNIC